MKKLLFTAAIITTISGSAFAKTEGNIVGANVSYVKTNNTYKSSNTDTTAFGKIEDNQLGFGVNYQYAFNFNNFFVAPEVFAERFSNENTDFLGDTVGVDGRVGAKVNLGYDINDSFSARIGLGYAGVRYDVDFSKGDLLLGKKKGTEYDFIYSIGASYKLNANIALNLEYDYQEVDFDTPIPGMVAEANISTVKLGASYQF